MKERNATFTTLSAIGIILIILGHLDLGIATFGGLFPYYSYHVMIFVFVAGYFYKPENEEHIGAFILHKAGKLLLPYFVWNLIYGIIAILMRGAGFEFAGELNLYNLFIAPFMGGHQFGLNAAAWFVPALFLLELCDILARKMTATVCAFIRRKHRSEGELSKDNSDVYNPNAIYGTNVEWLFMILYLAVGILVVYLAKRGSVYDYYKIPGRLMLMAPSLQLGRLYRTKLEKSDITPSIIYIPLVFVMSAIVKFTHGGLAYSTVWVTGFAGTVLTPFITTLIGIALWLRVAKILAKLFVEGRAVKDKTTATDSSPRYGVIGRIINVTGAHTFDIMMHHLAVFMIIKSIFAFMAERTSVLSGFDMEAYKSDLYYVYAPGTPALSKCVYLLLGLIIPILIGCMTGSIKNKICKNR